MMNLLQACLPVTQLRPAHAMVVATMGAMFAFDQIDAKAVADGGRRMAGRISSVPLMGGAAGLALGLALAQPERHAIVVDGDASLLMELGGLASVVAAQPAHFLHIVIANGTQFSGLANLATMEPQFSFEAFARAAGYAHAQTISDADEWQASFPRLLEMRGPVLVQLQVQPVPPRTGEGFALSEMPDVQFQRMGTEVAALRQWLKEAV